MESATLQEWIIFLLLETTRSAEALLVTSAGVAGGRLAFGFSLGAFQNNNIAWHSLEKSDFGTRKLLKKGLPSRENQVKLRECGAFEKIVDFRRFPDQSPSS